MVTGNEPGNEPGNVSDIMVHPIRCCVNPQFPLRVGFPPFDDFEIYGVQYHCVLAQGFTH